MVCIQVQKLSVDDIDQVLEDVQQDRFHNASAVFLAVNGLMFFDVIIKFVSCTFISCDKNSKPHLNDLQNYRQ